ncbi:MAG: YceI family protein [Symbiobacterium sp.]|uniref:YceI family protein n=1 Tax=Symbiobacterium sp. TaxID=1971213 RepID=UPI003464677A
MIVGLALAALVAAGCARGPAGGTGTEAAAVNRDTVTAALETNAQVVKVEIMARGAKFDVVRDRSEASYAVGETFLGQKLDVVAVGKTTALSGAIVLDEKGVIQPSVVEVDLTTLKSDQSRRDNRVQQVLDTRNHPRAVFQITGAEGDPVLKEGEDVPIKLQGTMTIKGTDRPLTFDGTARLEGDTITLSATATFNMTDFGVDPPNIANFVAVEEEVTVQVTFVGQKQG